MRFVQQVLDELCQKNNWGQPIYQLHSAIGPDQRQLFLYKITIPALATQYPNVYDTFLYTLEHYKTLLSLNIISSNRSSSTQMYL